jgi:DNA-binding response OmpR family regulator
VVSVRVLVVEQTDALREAYSDALSTAGMDVFTAKTVP